MSGKSDFFSVLLIFLLLLVFIAEGQNLVPNSGFEQNTELFCGPNAPNSSAIGWTFVSPFSPSIVSSLMDSTCRSFEPDPLAGDHAVSLMVSGEFNLPEVHQYIQTRLEKPLVPGRKYYAEFWYRPDQRKMSESHHYPESYNNQGIYFSEKELKTSGYRLHLASQLDSISYFRLGNWTCLSGYLSPSKEYHFIVLGKAFNNKPSREERLKLERKKYRNFSYFNLVDEVKVIDVTKEVDSLENSGTSFASEQITFKKNTAELTDPYESVRHLSRIVRYLKEKPQAKLKITGHTDDEGSADYNLKLSEERAAKVHSFFIAKGISAERLSYEGKGSTEPVISNTSAENRQKNRRVQFFLY